MSSKVTGFLFLLIHQKNTLNTEPIHKNATPSVLMSSYCLMYKPIISLIIVLKNTMNDFKINFRI